ncbi:MAG: cytochrome c, partial [Burkholderiales bacterium]|nr:cytochrome c [Burkholderiales bacterium]
MKRIAIAAVVVLIVIAAALFLLRGEQDAAAPTLAEGQLRPAWSGQPLSEQAQRGEYLALAGDCIGCHSVRGGQDYAGGLPMPTPFGTLYTPN